jgi:predicted dinucleotide-binding enzyme
LRLAAREVGADDATVKAATGVVLWAYRGVDHCVDEITVGVVIDASNPLDFSGGFPPKLAISGEDSLGELIQRALPDAKVVKALNIIGNSYFVDPSFREGKPTMLIAGDDEDAKRTVGGVLADFGWPEPFDLGGIEGARELEAICIAWVKIGGVRGAWDHGFKLLVG